MIYKDVNYRVIEVKDYKGNIDTHFICDDKTLFSGLDTVSVTNLTHEGIKHTIDFYTNNKKHLLENKELNERAMAEWYNSRQNTKI